MSNLRVAIIFLLEIVALSLALAPPASRPASAQECDPGATTRTVGGGELVEMLRSQQPVLLDLVLVEGDVDLSGIGTVRAPLVLTNSVIRGRLAAPFTIFEGTVDFTNSCFMGDAAGASPVDLHSSIFKEDVSWSQTVFGAGPDGVIDMQGTRFEGTTDIRGAQFRGPADFENVAFVGRVLFQQAQFDEPARFDRAAFQEQAAFPRTVFHKLACFEEASAAKNVDFSGSEFFGSAVFRRFSVADLLSLRDAAFEEEVILDRASLGSLEMRDNEFGKGAKLGMADIEADSLEMDIGDVDRIDDDGDKRRVLELVERTARESGKTAVANNASFYRQELEGESRSLGWRIPDLIFRQWVAGYFVRPLHPLFSMLGFVILASVVRLAAARFGQGGEPARGKRTLEQWLALAVAALGAALGASLGTIFALKPSIYPEDEERDNLRAWGAALGRGVEWFAQKGLTGAFLVAIGNTSPGAKDIISSLFRF